MSPCSLISASSKPTLGTSDDGIRKHGVSRSRGCSITACQARTGELKVGVQGDSGAPCANLESTRELHILVSHHYRCGSPMAADGEPDGFVQRDRSGQND